MDREVKRDTGHDGSESLSPLISDNNTSSRRLLTLQALPGRQRLLQALTVSLPSAENDEQFAFYLSFLQYRLRSTGIQNPVIDMFGSVQDPDNAVFSAMAVLAELIRYQSHSSLEQLVYKLGDKDAIPTPFFNSTQHHKAIKAVFIMTGWLTALYNPTTNSPLDVLRVEQESTSTFERSQQTMEMAKSASLCILLHGFGSVLPAKVHHPLGSTGTDLAPSSPPQADDVLRVAFINASHLIRIKRIRLEWTMSLGSHLDFDKSNRCVKVFCMPSLLLLQNQDIATPLSE